MGASASLMLIERNEELTSEIKNQYDLLREEGYLDDDIEEQLKEMFGAKVEEHRKKRAKEELYARIAAANPSLAKVDITPTLAKVEVQPASLVTVHEISSAKKVADKLASKINSGGKKSGTTAGELGRRNSVSVAQKVPLVPKNNTARNSRQSFTGRY